MENRTRCGTSARRALETAGKFFGCADDEAFAAWDGLPLMGAPEMGRASHWDTRIMRDDVMSYGYQGAVSAVRAPPEYCRRPHPPGLSNSPPPLPLLQITLAAMEDLGHYLANYAAALCLEWGLLQGCVYDTTRCGAGGPAGAAVVDAMDECEGRPVWLAIDDPLLAAKCAGGIAPCATVALNGYQSADGVKSAKLHRRHADHRRAGVHGEAGGGSRGAGPRVHGARDLAHWMQYLWIAVWVLGAIFVLGCARLPLPEGGSKP